MERIKKFQTGLAQVSLIVSAIMLATVALSILLAVLDRHILKIGMVWTEQYARYMLIWSTFIAANVLIYRNELMRVDFLDNFWPDGLKKVRESVYNLLFIVMLSILGWFGMEQAVDYIGVSLLGINIDKFWVYLCIPVGAILMMVQYLLNLLVMFLEKKGAKVA